MRSMNNAHTQTYTHHIYAHITYWWLLIKIESNALKKTIHKFKKYIVSRIIKSEEVSKKLALKKKLC